MLGKIGPTRCYKLSVAEINDEKLAEFKVQCHTLATLELYNHTVDAIVWRGLGGGSVSVTVARGCRLLTVVQRVPLLRAAPVLELGVDGALGASRATFWDPQKCTNMMNGDGREHRKKQPGDYCRITAVKQRASGFSVSASWLAIIVLALRIRASELRASRQEMRSNSNLFLQTVTVSRSSL